MDGTGHKEIAKYVIRNAEPELKAFFSCWSDDEIEHYAVVPDAIDKDNLENGYWVHSWKLDKNGTYVHGAAARAIWACNWEFKNIFKEGNFDEARSQLVRMTHYITDINTIPHVVSKDCDFLHTPYEKDFGSGIKSLLKEIEVVPVNYMARNSTTETAIKYAEDTWKGKDKLIEIYKKKKKITDDWEFYKATAQRIVQANRDALHYSYYRARGREEC